MPCSIGIHLEQTINPEERNKIAQEALTYLIWIFAVVFLAINYVVDALYALVDPRIRRACRTS